MANPFDRTEGTVFICLTPGGRNTQEHHIRKLEDEIGRQGSENLEHVGTAQNS